MIDIKKEHYIDTIIYSIDKINGRLKKKFINIKIGYILYKDFKEESPTKLTKNSPYNIIIPLSSGLISIKDLQFEGGYDYAEDWATAYYTISQLNLSNYQDNIIVHICDSSAHGRRFSDYDDNNDQEKLLIEALKKCSEKKLNLGKKESLKHLSDKFSILILSASLIFATPKSVRRT